MSDLLASLGITRDELIAKAVDKIAEETLHIQVSDEFEESSYDEDEESSHYRHQAVQQQIGSRLKKMMTAYFDAAFQQYAAENVMPIMQQRIKEHVFQQTTTWGEKKGEPKTVCEFLESKCKEYMEEQVDASGKTQEEANRYGHGHRFSSAGTRLTYMIGKEIDETIREQMQTMLKDVNSNAISIVKQAVIARLDEVQKSLKVAITVDAPKK